MTDLKEIAREIFLNTLQAIEPESLINRELLVEGTTLRVGAETIALDSYREVVIVGMGKACVKMGAAIERLLGERMTRGILVTDRRPNIEVRSEVIVAGHPLPNANSLVAGEKIVGLVKSSRDDTLIVFLISGGGSALVELPINPLISLDDLIRANHVLTRCGASIRDINLVRKHLSRIKGGRLGFLARKSGVVALVISDVNEGDVRSVASNPLLPEELEREEVLETAKRFGLMAELPASVRDAILQTPVSVAPQNWSTVDRPPVIKLLLDNSNVRAQAAALAAGLGFRVEVDAEESEQPYERVAHRLIERLGQLRESYPGERVCVVSGGEVLCRVRGNGTGGRNQEFVLYSASLLAGRGLHDVAVLSCGTDGIDGNSHAAGAVADSALIGAAPRNGATASGFITNNDTHSFFKLMGGLVVTGPTGNNARDLRVLTAQ